MATTLRTWSGLISALLAGSDLWMLHAWVVPAADDFFALASPARRAWIDCRVAQQLAERSLTPLDFTPLPVLGVPGWWPGQDGAFYADASVFRPRRSH